MKKSANQVPTHLEVRGSRVYASTALRSFLLLCSLLIAPAVGNGIAEAQQLYGYKSKGGVITFTSRKPASANYWTVKARVPSRSYFIVRGSGRKGARVPFRPTPSKYDVLIK